MAGLGFELDTVVRITALHDAAWSGDLAMVQLLIELGADPRVREPAYNATPLGWAAHNHQHAVVAYLVQFADIFAALACDGVDRVRALLAENPALANGLDAEGDPLVFNIRSDSQRAPELIAALVAHGADLNARNPAGKTRLDDLLERGHHELADLLARHGGKPAAALPDP